MRALLLTIVLIAQITPGSAQSDPETRIRELLAEQSRAWNRGSIDSFMIGYWKHDSLMFTGKSGITYGWQQTLDNYRKGYPDRAAMGELAFELLHLNSLSDEYYQVIGKWKIHRSKGEVSGYFTLLFRLIDGKWLIVSDHSS